MNFLIYHPKLGYLCDIEGQVMFSQKLTWAKQFNDLEDIELFKKLNLDENEKIYIVEKSSNLIFSLSENIYRDFLIWKEEQDQKVVELQKETANKLKKLRGSKNASLVKNFYLNHEQGKPYYGVFDSGYIYTFKPIKLGTVITIENTTTQESFIEFDYE